MLEVKFYAVSHSLAPLTLSISICISMPYLEVYTVFELFQHFTWIYTLMAFCFTHKNHIDSKMLNQTRALNSKWMWKTFSISFKLPFCDLAICHSIGEIWRKITMEISHFYLKKFLRVFPPPQCVCYYFIYTFEMLVISKSIEMLNSNTTRFNRNEHRCRTHIIEIVSEMMEKKKKIPNNLAIKIK